LSGPAAAANRRSAKASPFSREFHGASEGKKGSGSFHV
jgi:hypothetical protein